MDPQPGLQRKSPRTVWLSVSGPIHPSSLTLFIGVDVEKLLLALTIYNVVLGCTRWLLTVFPRLEAYNKDGSNGEHEVLGAAAVCA